MTEDLKKIDDLPSITPDAEDVSSYRRGNRSEAPKQSNFNGILVFIIALMVVVMGFGGYVLFQVQQKLKEATVLLEKSQSGIIELEGRLAATGSDVSATFEKLQNQSNTNFSEIDKLWAVAYRQNRPKIDQIAADLETAVTEFKAELDPIAGAVSGVGDQFDALNKELVDVKELVTLDSQERATEFSLLRQQVQDQSDALETQRRTLASLSKKLEEANADIRSNLEYRKRNNMEVLELKKRIQQLSEPSSTASDGV